VLLSQLKYHVLMMTANFVDLMIIDTDTVTFLFTIFPANQASTSAWPPASSCRGAMAHISCLSLTR
jgi:hypothetical protein